MAAPLGGRALVLPVIGCERAPVQAWPAGVAGRTTLGDFERLILEQAATVVALELMRLRVALVRLRARGYVRRVGVHSPQKCVDPDNLFPELERRGCRCEVTVS